MAETHKCNAWSFYKELETQYLYIKYIINT